jgi:hypothetical protein
MILTTTLRLLRENGACSDRYAHLAKALGGVRKYGAETPIPLWRILETNGRDDTYWAFRAIPEEQIAWRDRIARLHACDCICSTPLHGGGVVYDLLKDARSRNAIEVAERYALGLATSQELAAARDAAGDAARDAAGDAAWAAAWAAARAAARAAAGDAARAAAWEAAGDAAWEWQTANLALWLAAGEAKHG